MFSLDPLLHFIAATEPDVIEVYRSSAAISPPGARTQASEAFICAVMEENTVHVYVAVCAAGNKEASIYTSKDRRLKGESYDDTLKDALAFTESLGFGMESVNLNYGRALREVVVRGIKVICDPLLATKRMQVAGSATEYKNREKIAEKQPAKKGEIRSAPGKAESELSITEKEHKKKVEEEILAAEDDEGDSIFAKKIAAEILTVEPAEAAHMALKERETERAERERLLKEKMEAEKRAAEQAESARRAREKAETERIEREKVLAEKLAAEKRAEEQAEIARRALEEAKMERAARQKLLEEKAEAEKRAIEQLETEQRAREMIEAESVERARVAAEKAAAEKVAAERAEQQRLRAEKRAAEEMEESKAARVALEKAEAYRADCARVLALKAEAEKRAMTTAEAAGVAVGTAESDLAKIQNELVAKNAAEKALANQIDAERITWEKSEADRVETERRLTEKAAEVKTAEEKFEAARLGLQKAEAERAELERTLAEKAAAERGAAERMGTVRSAWEKAEADRIETERTFAEKTEFAGRALDRAEKARVLLEKATAERIEREALVQETLKEESRGRAVTAARKTIKGPAYVDLEKTEFSIDTACEERADDAPGVMEEKTATDIDRVSNEEASHEKAAQGAAGVPYIPGHYDGELAQLAVGTDTAPLPLSAIPIESPSFNSVDSTSAEAVTGTFGPQVSFAGEEAIEKAAWQLLEATSSFQQFDARKGVQSVVDVNEPMSSAFSGVYSGSPFFDSGESAPPVGFTIDKSLSNIIFCDQAEVRFLHQSLNTVRLTIEDFPSQNCAGYICAVERKAALLVFFALYLSENRKSLVYIPDKQPGNSEECERSIRDGITFAETVGYVMDRVEPSGEGASLDHILDTIPVFRRVARTRPGECACGAIFPGK